MSADSYLEYFLILLGWILNNAIWKTLLSTGLFALPIAGKVVATWLRTREEGTMRAIGHAGAGAHRARYLRGLRCADVLRDAGR